MRYFVFFLLLPCLLKAEKVFKIDEKEYKIMDKLALSLDPNRDSGKSSNWHNYTEIYSYYFKNIKNKPFKFLEIGINKGSGVRLWESYFENAELHFIDISLDHVNYFSDRSQYHIADQANPEQLLEVVRKVGGKFDIIIDDGGHTMTQQIVNFTTLFPYLNSGGMYIVEDLHTSYWKSHGGNGSKEAPLAGPNTAIEFFKDLVDEVNFVGARTGESSRR